MLPKDFTSEWHKFPAIVKAKLHEYDITAGDIKHYHLGWSEQWQRFIFPVYRGSDLVGFAARYYGNDPDLPKYITRYKNDGDLWQVFPCRKPHINPPASVVVEDMLSAIRCTDDANAITLFGTEMGDKCLDHAANMQTSGFLVFLDDDNPTVQRKALAIKDRLTMIHSNVRLFHSGGIDPKEFSKEDLSNILRENIL